MPPEHGPPRHKGEVTPALDQREPAGGKIHPAPENAIDPLILRSGNEVQSKLAGQL